MNDLKPCENCGRAFIPKRKSSRYCAKCRNRAKSRNHYQTHYQEVIDTRKRKRLEAAQKKEQMTTNLLELFQDLKTAIYLTKNSRWYDNALIANLEEIDAICDLIHLEIALPNLRNIETGSDCTSEDFQTSPN